MRVADKMAFDQVNDNIRQNRSKMADLQNKAATQKRVTEPSDDPVAAARVLDARNELDGNKQFIKGVNYAKNFLNFTDESLNQITQQLVRAKELALGQANDASANAESRRATATEVGQLYDQLVRTANRQFGDRFVFGGYKTTTQPFDAQGNYHGDNGEMMIPTDKGSFIAMNIPGSKVLLGKGLGENGVNYTTERQPTSIEELIEQKQENQANQGGDKPENASQNQNPAVRGPASKKETQDSSQNGVNVFDTLKKLEVALKTNDEAAIRNSITDLDKAVSQVVRGRAQVGSRVSVLEDVNSSLQKSKVDTNDTISKLQDADLFSVASDLNQAETTLRSTLQTSNKLIQPSLLNFLR